MTRLPILNPPDPSAKISPDEVMARVDAALLEACEFFQPSSEWLIEVSPSKPDAGSASIEMDYRYSRALIRVSVWHYQEYPHLIRRDIAHEVAHLMFAEFHTLWYTLPAEVRGGLLESYHIAANERATVRLERLFMRIRPEP